jgi:hypothetical protein
MVLMALWSMKTVLAQYDNKYKSLDEKIEYLDLKYEGD